MRHRREGGPVGGRSREGHVREPERLDPVAGRPLDGEGGLREGVGLAREELRRRGYDATGFDVSPRAVERCRERFPESTADYRVADLFDAPDAWTGAFDLVVESYTLQALPPAERDRAVDPVADFLAPGGTLVVVCRGRDTDEEAGRLPWPLTREQVLAFEAAGLELLTFDDFSDDREPPVRRFRAVFRRPA